MKYFKPFIICIAYFCYAFFFIQLMCLALLQLAGTDAYFGYNGYAYPCHAHDNITIHYSRFSAILFLGGPFYLTFISTLTGYMLLNLQWNKRSVLNKFIVLILLNSPLFYTVSLSLKLIASISVSKNGFHQWLPVIPMSVYLLWSAVLIFPVIIFIWSAKKFTTRQERITIVTTLPISMLICWFGWFKWLGPIIAPY